MIPNSLKKYMIEIYKLEETQGHATISGIANVLDLSVSATSKVAAKLKKLGYVHFEPYGTVTLTKQGFEIGKQLIHNHKILIEFYKVIGVEEKVIQQKVREIETYMSPDVVLKIKNFIETQVRNA